MSGLSRRKARENAFVALFDASFNGEETLLDHEEEKDEVYRLDAFGTGLVEMYRDNAQVVDAEIEKRLKGWDVKRISRVNMAVLRLAVAEMLYSGEDVDSIVINEAVELAKRYGDESDYQFVNGVLGSLSREKGAEALPGGPPEGHEAPGC